MFPSYSHGTRANRATRVLETSQPPAFYIPRDDVNMSLLSPGSFYGGWITSNLAGPFKGGPGSLWW